MNLLSIDPGAVTGFCLWLDGELAEHGELKPDNKTMKWKGKKAEVLTVMQLLVGSLGEGGLVVIEGPGYSRKRYRFDTLWSLGRRAGLWQAIARLNGIEPRWLHPRTWQKPCLGRGTRDSLKALSISCATVVAGVDMRENEADAFNMGRWVIGELRVKRDPWRKG
jgi:hypothetical protein